MAWADDLIGTSSIKEKSILLQISGVVPRGGVDLALAFLSEGSRFEPRLWQLWKKLFQDESLDSHNSE